MITAFLSGMLFGLGLIVSGMANPAKVLAFLDLAGAWDPSLVFVMVGAISIAALAFIRARRLNIPLPPAGKIDMRLAGGALLFGAGWGLAGFCPGPALVALGMGSGKALLFVLAMLAGMGLFELVERRRQRGGGQAGG